MDIFVQILLLILGFSMLVFGANYFVDGSSGIAKKFGISELVIGLTIVALGTSAPEAAVSITAALNGNAGITVGNVLGSNILNVAIILGITSVIVSVAIQNSTLKYEMPFMIIITGIMLLFGYTGNTISRIEGGILFALLIVYTIYLVKISKNASSEEITDTNKKEKKIIVLLLFIVIGLALIIWGSDIAVEAATAIAKKFNMSDRLIGLTIVALGTSLPELVTSVTAAIKGKADIAIGNVVGSNIANILFVAGLSAIIFPVTFEAAFVIDSIVAITLAVILLLAVIKKKALTRLGGIVLLISYAAYFVYLIQ